MSKNRKKLYNYSWLRSVFLSNLTAEQEIIQFYFRKIPLHQQKFLVVSIFSYSLWLQIFEKMKLLSAFQLATQHKS